MKRVSVRDLQKSIRKTVEDSQGERIVLTRRGEPVALIIGLEGMDWEDVVLQADPGFWREIEARRKEETIPLSEMRRRPPGRGKTRKR